VDDYQKLGLSKLCEMRKYVPVKKKSEGPDLPPKEVPEKKARPLSPEIAREVEQAETLANRIKIYASEAWRDARAEKARIIIGIETGGWSPDEQSAGMQALTREVQKFVDTLKRRGVLDNVTVVLGDSGALLANISAENPDKKDKVIVLGSERTLTGPDYKALQGALLACIDLRNIGSLDYISLLEMVTMALDMVLSKDSIEKVAASHSDIAVETMGERLVRLIPSKRIDINEPSRIYHLQIEELAKQA
jgi:hypothetical protein